LIRINARTADAIYYYENEPEGAPQMKNTPHELSQEFPEQVERLHALKAGDAHFAKLFDDYHCINRAIHRAEAGIEPTDDPHLTEMRKQRLVLKDQVALRLATSPAKG